MLISCYFSGRDFRGFSWAIVGKKDFIVYTCMLFYCVKVTGLCHIFSTDCVREYRGVDCILFWVTYVIGSWCYYFWELGFLCKPCDSGLITNLVIYLGWSVLTDQPLELYKLIVYLLSLVRLIGYSRLAICFK